MPVAQELPTLGSNYSKGLFNEHQSKTLWLVLLYPLAMMSSGLNGQNFVFY